MSEFESTSSFLEYNGKFFEIVYSDDHPVLLRLHSESFISLKSCSHQFFAQEQPPEDLFEAESDT